MYNNTRVTFQRQIQQVKNPMPAVVIRVEAVNVDITILLQYEASEVVLEKPEIGRADPNILLDNNCTDDELHCRMPRGSGDYQDEGDESDMRDGPWLYSSGLTWELMVSTSMMAKMATMRMPMRRNKHRKLMMEQRRL
jgi:hypothetical protein